MVTICEFKFDSDAWADSYADMLGIDPSLIVPGQVVAKIRQQRAQAQQAAAQAEQQQQAVASPIQDFIVLHTIGAPFIHACHCAPLLFCMMQNHFQ